MKKSKLISTILAVVFMFILVFSFSGCGEKTYTAQIVVKDYGTITLTLDAEQAPITVKHFVKLAESGAYDGSQFIRMQKDFVLQGGANAESEETIKGEFTKNGVNNTIEHKKGVISMARGNDNNSATTQFFLVLSDKYQSSLDGSYAGFGIITDGFEVVEKICADITSDDFSNDYYGTSMGFLKESSYITIETIKIIK